MIHIRIVGTKNFCDRPGLAGLTLRFAVNHMEWAAVLINVVGCRECLESFRWAIENMRADNVRLVWPMSDRQ